MVLVRVVLSLDELGWALGLSLGVGWLGAWGWELLAWDWLGAVWGQGLGTWEFDVKRRSASGVSGNRLRLLTLRRNECQGCLGLLTSRKHELRECLEMGFAC